MTAHWGWLTEPAIFPWVALIFGLCIGSFLNVVIHRLPQMMELDLSGSITRGQTSGIDLNCTLLIEGTLQQIAH